ncbi:hypothetical protein ACFPZ0_04595 [Streptomonospora nanhaiensis]|uniref:Uncharacterized protein n=1 Tax=Streptomonospora nanhaiensis TaxID=1323731 RepID=A0A853BRJ1_9ACTN|nr:hypothetical protein [Streptomonospora nanhaiensis]MBX9387421.1 hypothetical protein [Streptomonospora nanhaiensis]NYI97484.1 hypothetical protein [Streptomonospora nanhaiensis]
MNLEPVSAVAVAALGLAGVYLQSRRKGHAYDEIKHELELLSLLPETSPMRAPLQARIERSLADLIANRSRKSRDWTGISFTSFLLAVAVALTFPMLQGGWWWLLSVPIAICTLFGSVGFFDAIALTERDATGKRVTHPIQAPAEAPTSDPREEPPN